MIKRNNSNKHLLSKICTKSSLLNLVIHQPHERTNADYTTAQAVVKHLYLGFWEKTALYFFSLIGAKNSFADRVAELVQPYLVDADIIWEKKIEKMAELEALQLEFPVEKETLSDVTQKPIAETSSSSTEPAPILETPSPYIRQLSVAEATDPILLEMMKRMEEIEPLDKHPANFRQLLIQIDGHCIALGMMAHPWLYSSANAHSSLGISLFESIQKLRAASYHTLIALDDLVAPMIRALWQTGGEWYLDPISDEIPPDLIQLNHIYEIVKRAAQEKKNVVLHCRKGFGITGTVAASLVLRHIISKMPEVNLTQNTPVYTQSGSFNTTPMVAKAIGIVRAAGDPPKHRLKDHNTTSCASGYSVETVDQIHSLENLERALVLQKKSEEISKNETKSIFKI